MGKLKISMVDLNRKTFKDIDFIVLLAPIALTLFGCLGIYSSAPPGTNLWKKQLVYLVIGILLAIVITFTDYRKIIINIAPFLYAGVLFLLVLVVFTPLGTTLHGNRSWLHLPGLANSPSLQPSEFAKVATILMLARYIALVKPVTLRLKDIAIMVLIVLPPVILIKKEHDTGTMLTFLPILATFLFLAGMRKILIGAAIVVGVAGLFAVYPHLEHYQQERLKVIFEPDQVDSKGYAYQTLQSVIAVGSGGVTGKGITHGTQGRLGFLPFPYSDFIGAVMAEETGLVGILFIMALYMVLIMRLLAIARAARDRAGSMMIMGFVGLLIFHIACNLGMVVGLMPVMGIPLPLLSQGGTAVLSVFAGIGLAMSVRLKRFVN